MTTIQTEIKGAGADPLAYENYQRLIHDMARKGYARVKALGIGMDYEDVAQEFAATFARVKPLYDPSTGNRFSTFFVFAAWNDFNKLMERHSRELDVVAATSADAISENLGDEGEMTLTDAMATDGDDPLDALSKKRHALAAIKQLSPLARVVIHQLIDPCKALTDAFREQQVEAERLKAAGQNVRAARTLSIDFICKFLQRVYPKIKDADIRKVKRELYGIVESHHAGQYQY